MSESFFIILDKPVGLTSQQCLTHFKKKFGLGKVGHHGTLDPFATGLLLVGVGEATKFFSYVDDACKTYEATLELGVRTDTLDLTGVALERRDVPPYSSQTIEKVLAELTGKQTQRPPMYSAVKVNGRKLYELARQGLEVERKARDIEIFELVLLDWNPPHLKIRATVSRGTYIRVLAEDIAAKLENVAHLTKLVRTRLGLMTSAEAFDAGTAVAIPQTAKRPPQSLLTHHPEIALDETQFKSLIQGKKPEMHPSQSSPEALYRAFFQDRFLGLVRVQNGRLVAERLVNTGRWQIPKKILQT